MKKRMILFFLCCALSLGGILAAGTAVYRSRDQVEITETALYGDPAWAEGVTLTGHYDWSQTIYWDTVYTVGDLEHARTTFELCPNGRSEEVSGSDGRFDADVFPGMGVFGGFILEELLYGYGPILKDMAAEMAPGESLTRTVELRDYYEYYPFVFFLETGSAGVSQEDVSYQDPDDPWYLCWSEVFETLRDFFKIPIPEGSQATLTLELDDSGEPVSMEAQPLSDTCTPTFLSVVSDTAFYITFGTYGQFDYSQIPGGLGVYRLPYEEDGNPLTVHADQLENICPLPNDTAILGLEASADQSQIFLLTEEEGLLVLTVLDEETGEFQQRLELLELEDGEYCGFRVFEDCLLCTLYDGRFALAEQLPEGIWRLALVSALPEESLLGEAEDDSTLIWLLQSNWLLQSYYSDLLWNGERLTIAAPLARNWTEPEQTSVLVCVYDKTGVRYVGRYDSSLGPRVSYLKGSDLAGQPVSVFGSQPLVLSLSKNSTSSLENASIFSN